MGIDPALREHFPDLPVDVLVGEAGEAWGALEGVPSLRVRPESPEALGFRGATSNGVYLVKEWTHLPSALAVTVATFRTRTGRLVDTDILVNANFAFAMLAPHSHTHRFDLPSVLTHEMGHVFGLADAPDAPGATMWPIVMPGDTYQRDLADDDEAGAESIYAGLPWSDDIVGSGCGGASVLRGASHPTLWSGAGLTLLVLSVIAWTRLRRAPLRPKGRVGILLGGVLLFGGLSSPSLESQADAGECAPCRWSEPSDAFYQRRLTAFLKGGHGVLKGRAETSAVRRGGFIWTQVRVSGALGQAEFETPGGTLDGFTQTVSGRAPPRDGEELIVVLRHDGRHAWAHFDKGRIFGGSLPDEQPLPWD